MDVLSLGIDFYASQPYPGTLSPDPITGPYPWTLSPDPIPGPWPGSQGVRAWQWPDSQGLMGLAVACQPGGQGLAGGPSARGSGSGRWPASTAYRTLEVPVREAPTAIFSYRYTL